MYVAGYGVFGRAFDTCGLLETAVYELTFYYGSFESLLVYGNTFYSRARALSGISYLNGSHTCYEVAYGIFVSRKNGFAAVVVNCLYGNAVLEEYVAVYVIGLEAFVFLNNYVAEY